MASWLATGPPGICCSVTGWSTVAPLASVVCTCTVWSTVVAVVELLKFWTTPWRDQRERDHERDRQQDAHRRAGEVDPEVAERAAPIGGPEPRMSAAATRHADRGRHEVLHREPGHLDEVAHRRLARVGLPVGVGDEADRGVEGHLRDDVGQAVGQRQPRLHPLEQVQREHRDEAEGQQARRVDVPALLPLRVHPQEPVDQALDREEDPVAGRLVARRRPWPCSGPSGPMQISSATIRTSSETKAAADIRTAPGTRGRRPGGRAGDGQREPDVVVDGLRGEEHAHAPTSSSSSPRAHPRAHGRASPAR